MWLLPTAWIAIDVLRRFWPFEFPWHPPAAAFASVPVLLGSLPVWGATGLGWAAIAIGAGLWALSKPGTRTAGLASIGSALVLVVLFSVMAPRFEPRSEPLSVGVIQPGTSLEEKWNPSQWQEMERSVWRLTREAAEAGAVVVLWPESALPYRLDTDPTYREIATRIARDLDITIVLNSVAGSTDAGFTNSAFVIRPAGVEAMRYDKVKLVPFGEYVPSWARLAFTDALVREVGNFTPGRAPALLEHRRSPRHGGVLRGGVRRPDGARGA